MTLPRQLEPEVMDTDAEATDYDSMDHSGVNRAFAADFLGIWNGLNPILDVGTGTAQIPIEICKQSQDVEIVGIDLSEHMLQVGSRNVQAAGFEPRIRLQLCDAKQSPFANGSFGAVISNSIIHHIPDPHSVFCDILRLVTTGGLVFVRDLLRPDDLSTLVGLVERYAGDANRHQQQMFADSLHAALTLDEVRAILSKLGCDPASVEQTTDRHWTWAWRAPG